MGSTLATAIVTMEAIINKVIFELFIFRVLYVINYDLNGLTSNDLFYLFL